MADEFVPVALAEEEEEFTPVALAEEESDFTPVDFAEDEQPIDTRRIRGEAFKMLNESQRLSPRLQRDVADESSGIVGGTMRAGKNALGGIVETIGEAVSNPFTRTEAFTLNSIMGEATGGKVAEDLKEAAANPPSGSGDPIKTKEALDGFVKFFEGNGITDGKQMMEVLKDSIRENTWDPTTDDNARVLSDGSLRVNPKFVALPDAQAGIDAIMAAPVDDATRQQEVENFKAARKTAAAALDTKTKAFDEDYRTYAAEQAAKGVTDPEQVFFNWPGLDRNWIESSWDVVRDTVAEAGRGTAQTARGVVAGVGEKLGLEGLVEGVGRDMAASSQKSGFVSEIAAARGQNGAVVGTGKELGTTVLQMVPMFAGAGAGRLIAGAANAGKARQILGGVTAQASVFGYAGAQGYASVMQQALDTAQRDAEAQGRELTGEEINATVEKFQGAALANGLQTMALSKMLSGGVEKAALGGLSAQAGQLTGRDVLTAMGGQRGLRAALVAAKPEMKEFVKQAYKAGKVGFKDEALEEGLNQFIEGVIVKTSGAAPDKTWDQIGQETFKGTWMGGIVGGGLPVAMKTLAKTDPAELAARQLAAGAQDVSPAAAEAAMEPLDVQETPVGEPQTGLPVTRTPQTPPRTLGTGQGVGTPLGERLRAGRVKPLDRPADATPTPGSEPAAGILSPEETPAVPTADAETRNPEGVKPEPSAPLAATDAEGAVGEPADLGVSLKPVTRERTDPFSGEKENYETREIEIQDPDSPSRAYGFLSPEGEFRVVGINARPKGEEFGKATGTRFFERVISAAREAGATTLRVNLQSADTRKVLPRLVEKGIIANPRDEAGDSMDRHPTAFDIVSTKPTDETTPPPSEPAAPPVAPAAEEAPVPAADAGAVGGVTRDPNVPAQMTPAELGERERSRRIADAEEDLRKAKSGEERPSPFSNGFKSKAALVRDREAKLEAAKADKYAPEIWNTVIEASYEKTPVLVELVEGLSDKRSNPDVESMREQLVRNLEEKGYSRQGDFFVHGVAKSEPASESNLPRYEDFEPEGTPGAVTADQLVEENPEWGYEQAMEIASRRNRQNDTSPRKFKRTPIGTVAVDRYGELRVLVETPLDSVVQTEGTEKTNDVSQKYAQWLREGNDPLPAQGVQNIANYKGAIKLNDGHHRFSGARLAGRTTYPVWVNLTDPDNDSRALKETGDKLDRALELLRANGAITTPQPVGESAPTPAQDKTPRPYSPAALKDTFDLSDEQSVAVDALVQAMGLDTSRIQLKRGGVPGAGALAQDSDYMAAVERGDMETAQRMVDEAARAAGYTVGKAFHGTRNKGFTTFKTGDLGHHFGLSIDQVFGESGRFSDTPRNQVRLIEAYLDIKNPLELTDRGSWSGWLTVREVNEKTGFNLPEESSTGADIQAAIKAAGYDGVLYENFHEGEDGSMAMIAFDPEQIKSADPVTRDADGNVIPLSQRFNPESPSILYQFAGESANVPQFMRDSLDTAKAMAAVGKSSAEIRAMTGWFPGKYDGKMRWEIPDAGASFDTREFLELDDRAPTKLGDLLNHDALFEAYPELADVDVTSHSDFDSTGGGFLPASGAIDLGRNGGDQKKTLSTLLHEIQHWIQRKEGFAKGGNVFSLGSAEPEQRKVFLRRFAEKEIERATDLDTKYRKEQEDTIRRMENLSDADRTYLNAQAENRTEPETDLYDRYGDAWVDIDSAGSADKATQEAEDSLRFYEALKSLATELQRNPTNENADVLDRFLRERGFSASYQAAYRDVAGEIEARDAEARRTMTPEQRAATEPYSSKNVDPEAAITLFSGNAQDAKGSFEQLPETGDILLRGLTNPDVSTAVHELAHAARRTILNREVPAENRAGITDEDIAITEEWAGAKDGNWTVAAEEKFARGLERYLRDGTAPVAALQGVFDKIGAWLQQVYANVTGSAIDIEISDAMRAVFDKLVSRGTGLETQPVELPIPEPEFAERFAAVEESAFKEQPPNIPPVGPPMPPPGMEEDPYKDHVSNMHRFLDEGRARRGLPPIMKRPAVANADTWQAALDTEKAHFAAGKPGTAGNELFAELLLNPARVLTPVENAILMHEQALREGALDAAWFRLNNLPEGSALRDDYREIMEREQEGYDTLTTYIRAARSEAGSALQAGKMVIDTRDFSLARVKNEWHAAANSKSDKQVGWTAKDQSEAEAWYRKYEDLKKRESELLAENEGYAAELKRLTEDVERAQAKAAAAAKTPSIKAKIKSKLTPAADEARKRIAARNAAKNDPENPVLLQSGPAPELIDDIRDYSIILAEKMVDGVFDMAKASRLLIAEFGEGISEFVESIYKGAKQVYYETAESVTGEGAATPQQVLDSIDTEIEPTKADVWGLARAHVVAGARGRDVLENVFNNLSPKYPSLTSDRVAVLFTDYGTTSGPSTKPVAQELQRVKSLERIALKLADVRAKQLPKRTGFQRGDQDAEIRELEKQFREEYRALEDEMRAKGIPFEDSERRLKTALGAVKRRMLNEIEEIERSLAPGGKPRNAAVRQPVPYDTEAIDLRAKLEAKRAEYDAMFSKETTREKRVAAAIKTLDRQIAEEAKMLADGILKKAKGEQVTSPEIETRREQLRQMRQNRRDLYAAQNPGEAEADAMAAAKKAAQKAIERLGAAVVSGDVAVKKKDPAYTPDAELLALIEARETLSDMVAEMRRALPATPQQESAREKRMLAAAEATLQGLDAKLAAGDLSVKAAKAGAAVPASVTAVREKIKAANRQLDARRREAGVGPYSDTAREHRQLGSMRKRIAEYQRRLRTDDYSKKAVPVPVSSPEILRVQFELEQWESKYYERKGEHMLRNAPKGAKFVQYLKSTSLGIKFLTLGGDWGIILRNAFEATTLAAANDVWLGIQKLTGRSDPAAKSQMVRMIRKGVGAAINPAYELKVYQDQKTRPNARWDSTTGLKIIAPFDTANKGNEDLPVANLIDRVPWWIWPIFAGAKIAIITTNPVLASIVGMSLAKGAVLVGVSLVQKKLLQAIDRFQRTYTNEARVILMDTLIDNHPAMGVEDGRAYAHSILVATGRGGARKGRDGVLSAIERMMPGLNAILLASRYYLARILSLAAQPLYSGPMSGQARKAIAINYGKVKLMQGAVLTLLVMAFGKADDDDPNDTGVVLNPYSRDFLKIRLSNTIVIDVMGGFNQWMGIALRSLQDVVQDRDTGRLTVMTPDEQRRDISNFTSAKMNPLVRYGYESLTGEYFGRKPVTGLTMLDEATSMVVLDDLMKVQEHASDPKTAAALSVLLLSGGNVKAGEWEAEIRKWQPLRDAAEIRRRQRESDLNQ